MRGGGPLVQPVITSRYEGYIGCLRKSIRVYIYVNKDIGIQWIYARNGGGDYSLPAQCVCGRRFMWSRLRVVIFWYGLSSCIWKCTARRGLAEL